MRESEKKLPSLYPFSLLFLSVFSPLTLHICAKGRERQTYFFSFIEYYSHKNGMLYLFFYKNVTFLSTYRLSFNTN